MIRIRVRNDDVYADPPQQDWLINPDHISAVHFIPEVRNEGGELLMPESLRVHLAGVVNPDRGNMVPLVLTVTDLPSMDRLAELERS